MENDKKIEKRKRIYKILKVIAVVLVILAAGKFLAGCGDEKNNEPKNMISFSGHGEVSASPDIATLDITIRKEAKTVKEAQDSVAQVEKKTLEFLKTSSILDKDIKALGVSFNPKYEFRETVVPMVACYNCPTPTSGKSVLVGYEAYENLNIKIRNLDDLGKITQGLGTLGITELNGPNLAIDKEDAFKDQARKLAIEDAKVKAKQLAKDLGVRLGKISSFSENGNYGVPMYAKMDAVSSEAGAPAPTLAIPKGENLITSDVTITYELR